MYKLIPWSKSLDLDDFYYIANKNGFTNNSSQKMLVDCFNKEREYQVWILYQESKAVGSVAAHSLDILGPSAYRICARTCVFSNARPIHALGTANRLISEHQNLTDQFFIPACIEWAGRDKDLYISTHPSTVGKQRGVHNVYCPILEKIGILSKTIELEYRGHVQTFWKLNVSKFYEDIEKYPRWT